MKLLTPLERAWHYRELIRAVVRRELAARFRGSILGWIWAIFGPLLMLSAYTIIFSSAIGLPVSATNRGIGNFALFLFAGLIVFGLFSELAYRAPGLLHEHSDVIKKSIFPSETLAWTATIRACVYAGISFGVLLVFQLILARGVPPTVLLLPFVIIPMVLFLLGATWFLMALGSFTRDVTHLMISIVPMLMFATPVFYSIEDLPHSLQIYVRLNLVADYIEMIRDLLLSGKLPSPLLYAGTVLASLLIFSLSYRFFTRYKGIFVDVI